MTFFSKTSSVGEAGVGVVVNAVKTKMRWIYREQTAVDIGIDGEIEIVNPGETSTGILIKVQVKSTEKINLKQKISVPIERSHLNYWQKLQLPVIILLVDVQQEKAYWLPINANLSIPEGQDSISVHIDRVSELVASKNNIQEWAESAPTGVITRLLQLASSEAEDFNSYHFDIDDFSLSRSESVAREIVGMVRRLDSLVDGIISEEDWMSIRRVEKKIFEPRIAAIVESLNSSSDETADGNISASYSYDEDADEWRMSISGSISKGNDDSSDNNEPIWEAISERWSSADPEELVNTVQKELSEIKKEWDEDKRRREGYEYSEPEE